MYCTKSPCTGRSHAPSKPVQNGVGYHSFRSLNRRPSFLPSFLPNHQPPQAQAQAHSSGIDNPTPSLPPSSRSSQSATTSLLRAALILPLEHRTAGAISEQPRCTRSSPSFCLFVRLVGYLFVHLRHRTRTELMGIFFFFFFFFLKKKGLTTLHGSS